MERRTFFSLACSALASLAFWRSGEPEERTYDFHDVRDMMKSMESRARKAGGVFMPFDDPSSLSLGYCLVSRDGRVDSVFRIGVVAAAKSVRAWERDDPHAARAFGEAVKTRAGRVRIAVSCPGQTVSV